MIRQRIRHICTERIRTHKLRLQATINQNVQAACPSSIIGDITALYILSTTMQ